MVLKKRFLAGENTGLKLSHVQIVRKLNKKQQPSPYWFGSNINGEMQVIEQVHFNAGAFDFIII